MMNKILALVDNSVISPYFLKHLITPHSSLILLLNKEANSPFSQFLKRTTLELHFQKAKLFKKFRDTEIEIKTSSDGYLYELPINEPPPRSESKG